MRGSEVVKRRSHTPESRVQIPVPLLSSSGDDYVFPEKIVLDEASFEEFNAEMENPSEPTPALRALLVRLQPHSFLRELYRYQHER